MLLNNPTTHSTQAFDKLITDSMNVLKNISDTTADKESVTSLPDKELQNAIESGLRECFDEGIIAKPAEWAIEQAVTTLLCHINQGLDNATQ